MALLPPLGVKLQYETATPGTYADFAQVEEISDFSFEYGIAEVTNLDSVAAEFRGTLLKPGTVGFKLQYDPDSTSHAWLTTKLLSGISLGAINFKLKLTDTTPSSWAFKAIPSNFTIGDINAESKYVSASVTMQISGAPTIS